MSPVARTAHTTLAAVVSALLVLVWSPIVPAAAAANSARLEVEVRDTLVKVPGGSMIRVTVHANDATARGVTLKLASLPRGLRTSASKIRVGTVSENATHVVQIKVTGKPSRPARATVKATATADNAAKRSGSARLVALAKGSAPRTGVWKFAYRGGSDLTAKVAGKGRKLERLHGVVNMDCYSIYPPYVSVRPMAISATTLKIDKSGRVAQTQRRTYGSGGARAKVTLTLGARFTANRTRVAYLDVSSWVPSSSSSCYLGGAFLAGKRR